MKGIKRTEFDNGLVLLTEKRPRAKKTILLVGVKVGPINENDKLNGASHYSEHMLFKSNKYRSAKEIIEDMEFEGTSINAWVDHTTMTFCANSLPEKLTKAIDIIYEAATNFDYNKEEFERERNVILTEIQFHIERPIDYSLENLFLPAAFKATPLERTLAGTKKSMGTVTKEELEQFKKTFYVPNNMAIVAVGNFNEKELIRKIEKTFAKLEPGEIPGQDLKVDLINRRSKKFESHKSIKQVYLDIGFKLPGSTHKDFHKLSMLDGILSAGLSSRIFQKLREERGIGYDVGTFFGSFGDPGIFAVYVAGFDPKRFEEARDVILNEFKDLKTNPVSDRELQRTKNLLISQYYEHLENLTSRATDILEIEFDKLPYDFRKVPNYWKKITKQDILETAQKYLTDKFTLTALVPKNFKTK
jgi:predicted Zn-dependent peptidase